MKYNSLSIVLSIVYTTSFGKTLLSYQSFENLGGYGMKNVEETWRGKKIWGIRWQLIFYTFYDLCEDFFPQKFVADILRF